MAKLDALAEIEWPLPEDTGDVPPKPAAEESALVQRAQQDRHAFAPLYARYAGPVYRCCYRRLGNKEAAEDATSLVFTLALTALPRYEERGGSFRSWLFAIAHNVVGNSYRGARSEQPLATVADLPDGSPSNSPEDAVLAAEERSSLRAVLARLPESQRQVVELRLAGLSGPEIARALGRSHGAIKVAHFRAVARLRLLLGIANAPEEERHEG